MSFRPLADNVLIKRIEADQVSKGGILIPDAAQEKPARGTVIAAGPGARDEAGKLVPVGVVPKDEVLFGKWTGTEIELDGDKLVIVKGKDILGVIDA